MTRRAFKPRKILGKLLLYAALTACAWIILFPILGLLSASFKIPSQVFAYPPQLIPDPLTLTNYLEAWSSKPLDRFLSNSIVMSSIITFGQLATSVTAGYAFAYISFPGRKLVFGLIIATLLIPGEVTIISNFITIADLGLLDTMAALTLPSLASGFGIFLMRQFFLTVPREYFDAAVIDGAGHPALLWHVALPMARPALGALGAFAFLSAWNQYFWPLLVTRSTGMQTVQIGIAIFQNQEEGSAWGVVAAATIIVLLPTLIAFFVAQKQFVKGINLGGLKG